MSINEFEVGKHFFTGSGEWICVDIGTKFVLAVKKSDWHLWEGDSTHIVVFDQYDFGGCSSLPFD